MWHTGMCVPSKILTQKGKPQAKYVKRVDIEFCHSPLPLFSHLLHPHLQPSVRFFRVANLHFRILRIPQPPKHPGTSVGEPGKFNLLLNF